MAVVVIGDLDVIICMEASPIKSDIFNHDKLGK